MEEGKRKRNGEKEKFNLEREELQTKNRDRRQMSYRCEKRG